MKSPRPDMSEWVLHFVHDRDPENNVTQADLTGDYELLPIMPAHVDPDVDRRFYDFHCAELERDDLEPDAGAASVLSKIVDQGILKSGWSFRSGKTTIYGPNSAVCFTEMPLSSLVEYAKSRNDSEKVGEYAIGLLKSELYVSGGRPVIYGLTGDHKETERNQKWPRFLHPDCGIGEHEQYRYVSLNLGSARPIDWTHEREWRWSDSDNTIDVPGLPVWINNSWTKFSRAVILVKTDLEAKGILSQLRRQWDSEFDNWDTPYNLDLIKTTKVVSLEALEDADLLKTGSSLTIESIPGDLISIVPSVSPSKNAKERVQKAISEAQEAATRAAEEWESKNEDRELAGFAKLIVEDGLAEFTRAGLELELLDPLPGSHPFGPGGYWVRGLTSKCRMQSIGQHIAAVEAAQRIIEAYFPDLDMRIWTRDD